MPSHVMLPQVDSQETSDTYGRFVIHPLEPGMGVTVGNALRRVLLSSLPGTAITWVKIDQVSHEFSTVPHLKEDVIELLLNLKGLRLRSTLPNPGKLFLEVEGAGVITAADITQSAEFEVVNPELYVASMDSPEARLSIEMNVEQGKGYVPAGHTEGLPVGALPMDAIFTPVRKVNYKVEQVRSGVEPDSDRLILEVWTDATITPLQAVSQAAALLAEVLAPIGALATETFTLSPKKPKVEVAPEQAATLIEDIGFTVRTYNALKRGGIGTLGDLLERGYRELSELRQFGPKAQEEVRERLQAMGFWKDEEESGGEDMEGQEEEEETGPAPARVGNVSEEGGEVEDETS